MSPLFEIICLSMKGGIIGGRFVVPLVSHGKEPVGRLDVRHQRARRDLPTSPPFLQMRVTSMTHYSEEFKASVTAKMLPPHNVGIADLAHDTGVPRNTLYTWRNKLGSKLQNDTRASQSTHGKLSSEEKFAAVIESASLNEVELSEYCRRKGLYPEQIQAWSKTCMQANAAVVNKADKTRIKMQAKQLKQLESELRRKDKALAETAALLVLQKKVQAIWGDPEDEKSHYGSGRK